MSTSAVTLPQRSRPRADDDLAHLYCECDPDVSLCGLDISGEPEATDPADWCVVCDDLNEFPCPRCGES